MPVFSEDTIRQVRARTDIVDVISQYVSLEKHGKEFKGICPFHDDHDPSMSVSPDKQIFKCFVCGAGGNVFSFLQKIEQITFPEAVTRAAAMAGIDLKLPQSTGVSPNQQAWNCLQSFTDYARYFLDSQEGEAAKEYCRKRKLSDEILETFEIGWAPGIQRQDRFFQGKGWGRDMLVKTGLLQAETGRPVFTDRLLIPIHDRAGHPVGYTARTLAADADIPKYVNTPATPLYTKGDLVFNYHRAKPAARKAGRVILAEGAMDVIGLSKAGIREAVANLGTACTDTQLELLRQLQVPVHVFYDSDAAGRKAAYQFGKKAMAAGIPFVVVSARGLKDPDEIFQEKGAEFLQETVERTISFPEFLLDYLAETGNLENYEEKLRYGEEVSEAAWKLLKDFEQPAFFQKLRDKTGFDFSVRKQVPTVRSRPSQRRKEKARPPLPAVRQGRKRAEEAVLQVMLSSRSAASRYREEVGFFDDPACHILSLYIYDAYRRQESLDPQSLFDRIEEEEAQGLLADLMARQLPENAQAFFDDSLGAVKDHVLGQEIDSVNKRIQETDDLEEKSRLAQEKMALVIARHQARNRKEG